MRRFTYCFLALLAPLSAQADPTAKARAAFAFIEPALTVAVVPAAAGTWDVLEELNEQRKARGLPPYIWDRELTMAAGRASKWRAERLQFGHAPSDFAFLAPGVSADAAGCAAYPESYGFMACACYEPGTHYAGAAYTLGSDGKRYCHLFIRSANQGPATAPQAVADCPSGSWGTVTRSQSASRWRRR